MGILVLVVFWVAVVFAFCVVSPKTGLCFAGLWVLGLVILSAFHIAALLFVAYEALLAAILWIMLKNEWA
jgi:hypothetical protein